MRMGTDEPRHARTDTRDDKGLTLGAAPVTILVDDRIDRTPIELAQHYYGVVKLVFQDGLFVRAEFPTSRGKKELQGKIVRPRDPE